MPRKLLTRKLVEDSRETGSVGVFFMNDLFCSIVSIYLALMAIYICDTDS